MKNIDLFKKVFGSSAIEVYSMSKIDFLNWLNKEADNDDEKKGEWIESKYYPNVYVCSCCMDTYVKKEWIESDKDVWNFCPNCGADMRGE